MMGTKLRMREGKEGREREGREVHKYLNHSAGFFPTGWIPIYIDVPIYLFLQFLNYVMGFDVVSGIIGANTEWGKVVFA